MHKTDIVVRLREGWLRDCGGVDVATYSQLESDAADEIERLREALNIQKGKIMSEGLKLIAAERQRQIEKEGWTPEHDDEHREGQMALVAALYATPYELFRGSMRQSMESVSLSEEVTLNVPVTRFEAEDAWPLSWDLKWDKRNKHDRKRRLEIAGALIAAELDRLLRTEACPVIAVPAEPERCTYCEAGDDKYHSFICPTRLHPNRREDSEKAGLDGDQE